MNQIPVARESTAGNAWLLSLVVPTSLAVGFAETGIALFTARTSFSSLGLAVVSAGATSTVVLLVIAPAYFLLGPLLRRISRASRVAIAFGLSSFFLILFVLLSIGDHLTTLVYWAPTGEARLELVLLLLAALAGSSAVGLIVDGLEPTRETLAKLVSAGWALPLLLSEAMIGTWIWRVALPGAGSRWSEITIGIVFMALVALSAVAIYKLLPRAARRPGRAATFMVGAAVLLPASSSVFSVLSDQPQHLVPAGEPQLPAVVLIVVDTLRADALSIYGSTTPTENTAALARDGVVFRRAYSAASWTLPSVSSLMTGLSPAVHGAVTRASRLPEDVTTLAEYMQRAGYVSGAVGDNMFLRPPFGLSQGFSHYRFFPGMNTGDLGSNLLATWFGSWGRRFSPWTESAELTSLATDWVEAQAEKSFFLWLHYFDPHLPYAPPTRFLESDARDGRVDTEFSQLKEVRGGYFVPTPDERKRIRELYQAEVRYIDEQIGVFLDFLKENGLYDDALIILTSDHGEEFWEHGGFEHGHSLWNELLHVPLVIKPPRSTVVGSYEHPVSTVAVMPTILELCGIDFEEDLLSAQSLASVLRGKSDPRTPRRLSAISGLYFEPQSAVIFDDWKYTRFTESGTEALYDMRSDPAEQSSVIDREADALERARRLAAEEKKLARELRRRLRLTSTMERAPLEPEELRRLRSLGYIQ